MCGCDLVALASGEPTALVVCELKLAFSLDGNPMRKLVSVLVAIGLAIVGSAELGPAISVDGVGRSLLAFAIGVELR